MVSMQAARRNALLGHATDEIANINLAALCHQRPTRPKPPSPPGCLLFVPPHPQVTGPEYGTIHHALCNNTGRHWSKEQWAWAGKSLKDSFRTQNPCFRICYLPKSRKHRTLTLNAVSLPQKLGRTICGASPTNLVKHAGLICYVPSPCRN